MFFGESIFWFSHSGTLSPHRSLSLQMVPSMYWELTSSPTVLLNFLNYCKENCYEFPIQEPESFISLLKFPAANMQ